VASIGRGAHEDRYEQRQGNQGQRRRMAASSLDQSAGEFVPFLSRIGGESVKPFFGDVPIYDAAVLGAAGAVARRHRVGDKGRPDREQGAEDDAQEKAHWGVTGWRGASFVSRSYQTGHIAAGLAGSRHSQMMEGRTPPVPRSRQRREGRWRRRVSARHRQQPRRLGLRCKAHSLVS
jgi:hypothetical protein